MLTSPVYYFWDVAIIKMNKHTPELFFFPLLDLVILMHATQDNRSQHFLFPQTESPVLRALELTLPLALAVTKML